MSRRNYKENSNLFYNSGDTITINESTHGGYLTTNGTDILFSIPLPKSIGSDVKKVTITSGKLVVRQNGNYIFGDANWSTACDIGQLNVSITISHSQLISLRCKKSGGYTDGINNDAVGVNVAIAKITFS